MVNNRRRSWRVLVADDQPAARHHLARLLDDQAWEIVEVNNGKEAEQCIRDRTVDLAILEARLFEDTPMRNLIDNLQESFPVPLVVCSSDPEHPRADTNPFQKGLALLNRPFTRDELFAAVQQACQTPPAPPMRISKMDLEQKRQLSQRMELLGRLAAGVVHDFNNLLTVILGAGTMLQDSVPAGNPMRMLVDQINQAAQKGASLTTQLLAFSRHQTPKPCLLQLNQALGLLDPLLRHMIGKQVSLIFNLCPALGYINADPSQIDQVIMNLALNARDAMPYGGKLVVETANVDLSNPPEAFAHIPLGAYVTLSVRDNGSGMNQDTLDHLFEPFFTTKKNGQGSGLGLATVHSILQQAGGYIAVTSEIGRGSAFTIFFPRVEKV